MQTQTTALDDLLNTLPHTCRAEALEACRHPTGQRLLAGGWRPYCMGGNLLAWVKDVVDGSGDLLQLFFGEGELGCGQSDDGRHTFETLPEWGVARFNPQTGAWVDRPEAYTLDAALVASKDLTQPADYEY